MTQSGNLRAVTLVMAPRTRRRCSRLSRAAAAKASCLLRYARRAKKHSVEMTSKQANVPIEAKSKGNILGTHTPPLVSYQMLRHPQRRSAVSTNPSGQTKFTVSSAQPAGLSPGGPNSRRFAPVIGQPHG
eukprot:scaffold284363_cov32-Tisochrysis_lutea.AAC.2